MDFKTWPRLVVVDFEGNGINPPEIVEFAAVPIIDGRVEPGRARSLLIRPPHPITQRATGVHGITNAAVADCPTWSDLAERIEADLAGAWIAAHNAAIDYRVLRAHLPGWTPPGVIDTLRLSRAVHPGRTKHRLDDMMTRADIDLSGVAGQRHRAGFDAQAAALLLLALAGHYDTFDALAAAAVPVGLPGSSKPGVQEQTLW